MSIFYSSIILGYRYIILITLTLFSKNIMGAKLLRTRLERFITKSVLIVFVILSIAGMVCIENKYYFFFGLLAGTLLGILRFGAMSNTLSKLLQKSVCVKQPVFNNILFIILNQLIVVAMLAISLAISIWFFAGMVSGVLSVPFVVFIYSILNGLGILKSYYD